MDDVRWIKITVDMFDNRKIKHLRRLPNGDSIVLIWVMLLTLAGRCNAGGMVFLTENIPYTPSMLADELGFDEATITLALKSFEALGMVSTTEDSFLHVDGWEEHQNIKGMEKIRERKRLAQAKWRAKKKELSELCSTVDSTVEVGSISVDHAEIEKDIEKDKKDNMADKPPKREQFSPPSIQDVTEYCQDKGYQIDPEAFVAYYDSVGWMIGKKNMKSWKSAVVTWAKREHGGGTQQVVNTGYVLAPLEDPWEAAMRDPEKRKAAGYD